MFCGPASEMSKYSQSHPNRALLGSRLLVVVRHECVDAERDGNVRVTEPAAHGLNGTTRCDGPVAWCGEGRESETSWYPPFPRVDIRGLTILERSPDVLLVEVAAGACAKTGDVMRPFLKASARWDWSAASANDGSEIVLREDRDFGSFVTSSFLTWVNARRTSTVSLSKSTSPQFSASSSPCRISVPTATAQSV